MTLYPVGLDSSKYIFNLDNKVVEEISEQEAKRIAEIFIKDKNFRCFSVSDM